ncbi:GNAT family N-acetyltransferase [Phenylobacterium sp.]|jgi:ribosomal-protein-alanine N-acetyltransferase|uniref:GNAT family N-acetyltransferase n=1 Tax=Phenylobacterium sp. TaxID=1871053 RepID=UPI0037C9B419
MTVRRAGAEDLAALADLHAAAFSPGWSAAEIASLDAVALIEDGAGMILVRTVAGEAEVLTVGVRPEARGAGTGRRLVQAALEAARADGAERVFLEVAEDNLAALRLYAGCGFGEVGRRRRYYPRPDDGTADALVLRRALNTEP